MTLPARLHSSRPNSWSELATACAASCSAASCTRKAHSVRCKCQDARERADPQGPGEGGCFRSQLLAVCAARPCLRFAAACAQLSYQGHMVLHARHSRCRIGGKCKKRKIKKIKIVLLISKYQKSCACLFSQNCVIAGIMVVEFADDDIEPFSKVRGSDGSRTKLRARRSCGGFAAREKPAHGGARVIFYPAMCWASSVRACVNDCRCRCVFGGVCVREAAPEAQCAHIHNVPRRRCAFYMFHGQPSRSPRQ